jgi:phage terminase large subunit GpA-like protein
MTPEQKLIMIAAKLCAPPPVISVSDWADANFFLSPEYAAESGRWTTLPFQREPLDATGDPHIWQVVVKSCTQLLKTSVIQISAAHAIAVDPGPILIIQPRESDAKAFSKERIAPMLRDVPCLVGKVADSKAKKSDNTIEEKWFKGGLLAITSAGSPGNLARRAIRYLSCDEEDKWVASAGSEGKPFSLAMKRTATFRHRKKVIRCCSPTVENSSIDLAYQESDQREYFIPCPKCGLMQSLMQKFRSQVRWDNSLDTKEAKAHSARYHCEGCDAAWGDYERWQALEAGEWRAQAPFNGIAGFWISELYSPWKQLWEIVMDYLVKKDSSEDLKTFVNTSLAENWTEPGETVEWERLVERREYYETGVIPEGGLVLTAGVDVQRADGGRLEVEILATGENRETWSVDYRVFHGDPAAPEVWRRLETLLSESFVHALGGELLIERLFVDSGDGTTTREVYEWVRSQPRGRVWAIKGDRRSDQPVGPPRAVESMKSHRVTKHGAILRSINVDFFKSAFYADLRKRKPTHEEIEAGMFYPQGYCHFPVGEQYGDEYFRQLCAEQLVTHRKHGRSRTEFISLRPRNEALDCRVYAMAAAWEYGVHRFQPRHWEMLRARVKRDKVKQEASAPAKQAEVHHQPARPWIPERKWFG